jgi:hypothetical protein
MSADGTGSSGAVVTGEDVGEALPVLRIAARWALTPARWSEVARVATAAMAALATNDGPALRASVEDIMVLGPVRAVTASTAAPAPYEVLTDLTALIDVLADLEDLGDPGSLEADARDFPVSISFPVSIYLRDEAHHEQVERAVQELMRSAGLSISARDDPVLGSWWRQMRATLARGARSGAGQEVLAAAGQRADIELVLRPEAEVAALWMANLAPLITSLENTGDAVVYLGMVLLVKNDGALAVNRLTTRQQFILNHSPHLLAAPDKILRALGLPPGENLPTAAEAGRLESSP